VLNGLRGPLESALRAAFGADADTLFGLGVDLSTTARRRGDVVTLDRRDFTASLQRRGNQVRDLLAGSSGEDGLVIDLLQATDSALGLVNRQLGLSGRFIDTFA
jgi:hypothetical protein